jgi:mRNA interferase MazF
MSRDDAKQVHRGEVWLAQLNPVQGDEMGKTRPVVVVSADGLGVLAVKLVAPCTTTSLPPALWRIPLRSTAENGLDRDTTVDLMQLRSISIKRLVRKLGVARTDVMEDISAMVAAIVEYA